mmetsp:Transcript_28667/g.71509  ORF Transcript_28667/g.71509 Transcript_28667/m.71509 type:complete len:208 (-) Transcript_28667:232-855(-)
MTDSPGHAKRMHRSTSVTMKIHGGIPGNKRERYMVVTISGSMLPATSILRLVIRRIRLAISTLSRPKNGKAKTRSACSQTILALATFTMTYVYRTAANQSMGANMQTMVIFSHRMRPRRSSQYLSRQRGKAKIIAKHCKPNTGIPTKNVCAGMPVSLRATDTRRVRRGPKRPGRMPARRVQMVTRSWRSAGIHVEGRTPIMRRNIGR